MNTSTNYRSICTVLRHFRESRGFTPEELAAFFGADASLIDRWESGITEPTISECLLLSRLYGISLEEMFSAFDARSIVPEACMDMFDHAVSKQPGGRPQLDNREHRIYND